MSKGSTQLVLAGSIMFGLGHISNTVLDECGILIFTVFCLMAGAVYAIMILPYRK